MSLLSNSPLASTAIQTTARSSAGPIFFVDEEAHCDAPQFSPMTALESTHKVLLESMSDGVFIAHEGHFVHANPALHGMLGYAHHEFVGLGFEQVVAPEFLEQWKRLFAKHPIYGEDTSKTYRMRLLKKGRQEEVWVDLHASGLDYEGQHSMLGIACDVTQRRRVEQCGHLRDHVLERLALGAGLESVLHSIVFATEEVIPQMCCGVLLLNPGSNRLRRGVTPHFPELLVNALDGMDLGWAASHCGLATRPGEQASISEMSTLPASVFSVLAAQEGLHACWSMPLTDAGGQMVGVFVAYYNIPGTCSMSDMELLQQATNLAGLAIVRKRS